MESPQLENIVKVNAPFVDEISGSVNAHKQAMLPAAMKRTLLVRQRAKKMAECMLYMKRDSNPDALRPMAILTDLPSGELREYSLINVSEDGRFVLSYIPKSRKVSFRGCGNRIDIYEVYAENA